MSIWNRLNGVDPSPPVTSDPTILPASVVPESKSVMEAAGWREWDMLLPGDTAPTPFAYGPTGLVVAVGGGKGYPDLTRNPPQVWGRGIYCRHNAQSFVIEVELEDLTNINVSDGSTNRLFLLNGLAGGQKRQMSVWYSRKQTTGARDVTKTYLDDDDASFPGSASATPAAALSRVNFRISVSKGRYFTAEYSPDGLAYTTLNLGGEPATPVNVGFGVSGWQETVIGIGRDVNNASPLSARIARVTVTGAAA